MKISKDRLGAFTDAIIAIAATIMALELATPLKTTWLGLGSQWLTFVAYIISFSLIWLGWLNYYTAFEKLENVGIKEFLWNGVWVFIVTLIPFATRWVSEHPDKSLPEFLYCLVMFSWAVVFQLMENQIIRDYPKQKISETYTGWLRYTVITCYIIAMVMAFIIPICSIFIVALIVVIWMIGLVKAKIN